MESRWDMRHYWKRSYRKLMQALLLAMRLTEGLQIVCVLLYEPRNTFSCDNRNWGHFHLVYVQWKAPPVPQDTSEQAGSLTNICNIASSRCFRRAARRRRRHWQCQLLRVGGDVIWERRGPDFWWAQSSADVRYLKRAHVSSRAGAFPRI